MANELAEMLSQKLGSRVEVGSVKIDLFNMFTIDSLTIYDKASMPMLTVGKTIGTVELMPMLLENLIKISNLKIFDSQAVLYRNNVGAQANYQYAIDSLMKKNNHAKDLEVDLHSIIIRNLAVRYDVHSEPANGQMFDMNHIDIERFNANLVFGSMKADSIAVRVRSACVITRNGVILDNMIGNVEPSGRGGYNVELKSLTTKINDKLSGVFHNCSLVFAPMSDEKGNFAEQISGINLNSTFTLNNNSYDIVVVPEVEGGNAYGRKYYDVSIRSKNTPSYIKTKICDWHKDNTSWLASLISDIDFDVYILREDMSNVLDFFGYAIPEHDILDAINFVQANGNVKMHDGRSLFNLATKARSDIFDIDGVIEAKENNATYNINVKHANIVQDNKHSNVLNVRDGALEGELLLHNYKFSNVASLDIGQILSNVSGNVKVSLGNIDYIDNERSYSLNNLRFTANSSSPCNVDYLLTVNDPNANIELKGMLANFENNAHFTADAEVRSLKLTALGMTNTTLPDVVMGNVEINAQKNGDNFDDYTIKLNNLQVTHKSEENNMKLLGDIVLTCRPMAGNRIYSIGSDFMSGELTANVGLVHLANIVKTQMHGVLPSLYAHAMPHYPERENDRTGYGVLKMTITDLSLLSDYFSEDIFLDKPMEIMCSTSEDSRNTSLTILSPSLEINDSRYTDIGFYLNCNQDSLGGVLMLTKYFDDVPVKLENHISGAKDQLFTETLWKNLDNRGTYGSLKTETMLHRSPKHHLSATTHILPSTLFISDTSWQVSRATLEYGDDVMRISNLIVSRGDQYVNVNADFGKDRKDLLVQLNDVEVAYLLGLANFTPVDFDGKASGTIKNSVINPTKELEADLFVRDFLFNGAYLGALNMKGSYNFDNNQISLKAKTQATYNDSTLIDGIVSLDDKTLDIYIKSDKINLQFLNKYLGGFICDLEGTATGDFRLFGNFRDVQMEADEVINYLKFRPKMLGVLYSIENQPIQIRPDTIDLNGFVIRDPYGSEASVSGFVNHHYLCGFNYNIDFNLNNLLMINWDEQPMRAFWGKIFTDGTINLHGTTSEVNLSGEISAVDGGGVDDGSSLYYNSGTYGSNEEGRDYVYFLTPHTDIDDEAVNTDRIALSDQTGTDVRVDVKLDATPNLALNIVTDPFTHDFMTLYGYGAMQLSYYNKGSFTVNGLYTINDGNYKLTIKDIIHKNFNIQPGGYLRFNGSLSDADINLKGVHRINSVSLSDLNVGASQSNSTVGVDCILNFTGKAAEPKVSFDIDFPKANNDENLLLKKFILTEEDRNMQAVYLLSIGRFYTYNYNDFSSVNGGQSQSMVAMTSFLASTLSGQINNVLQDAFHITNWNFDTSIATGRMGFNDMEVLGSLSGRMFNNRLLFNGNVGYRDQATTYSNNFIGDFNLQWLLNKSGTISLKAYSETNDRYFTKSSLTTQGGGILFQRDFRRLRDFFRK